MTGPVMLPDRRGVKIDKPRMIDWGGQLKPPNGGAVQNLLRLGTRHAIDITLPQMRAEPEGRIWAAKLRLAKLYGVMAWFRQDGLRIGTPGDPATAGAGQSGSVINLGGFRPGYCMRMGQAGSLLHAGRRYLHFAEEDTVAASDGTMALPIFPMLRVIADDAEAFEVAKPIIVGSLSGNEVSWTRLTSPYADFGTITITEDE